LRLGDVEEWPLVGRQPALDTILEQVTAGRTVVVAGDAGVGKSRLVREAAAAVEERGWMARRVAATAAAASIPFGALVSLFPPNAGSLSALDLLAAVRSALRDPDGDGHHVLLVDDMQRLDVASATLVHQVVTEQLCPVLGTVRAGERAPDAIDTLFTGGAVVRIDLTALAANEVGELIETALGAQCDARVVRSLSALSGGNPLYLRELVRDGVASGWLGQTSGVWRIVGSPAAPARLTELVAHRLAELTGTSRDAMDVLATAERIEIDQLLELVDVDGLEQLERVGLAGVESDGGRTLVVLAHPLYGEAARAALPVLRRRRIVAALADVVERAGMAEPGDVVRVARWRLDAGSHQDPDLLTNAAREAWMANDFALAEQLADAGRSAGAGFDAGFVLAEVAMLTGRHAQAEALMAALELEAFDDADRVHLASARAFNLAQNLGGDQEAITILERTLQAVDDVDLADTLRARLAVTHALAPRPQAALDAAEAILQRPASPAYYRATYATSISLAVQGRLEQAVAVGADGFRAHDSARERTRQLPETQHIGPVLALVAAGRLEPAGGLARLGHERSVAVRDAESQATFAVLIGIVAVHAGQVVTALRSFREAAAINTDLNDVVALRWSLGGIALSAGLAGDAAKVGAARDQLDSLAPSDIQILELDLVERGRAWLELAAGEHSRSASRLEAAADLAASTDQLVVEAVLRHDLARISDPAAPARRLAELAATIDGELVTALAGHARALSGRDGRGIEHAARTFELLGYHLDAAIAASLAAPELRAEGLARLATSCDALAREALSRCQGARTTIIPAPAVGVRLTRREREVAILAGQGLPNREIAERLFLSARTVENHLQHAYEKLGITARHELAAALKRIGDQ
jgi:DNA-binding CsgD family transcriptional regulator